MTRYELAMCVMKDTANRSMRKAGRTAWSRADYNAGVAAFNKHCPIGCENDPVFFNEHERRAYERANGRK